MIAIDPDFGAAPPDECQWVPSPGFLLRRNRILAMMQRLPTNLSLLEMGCGAGAILADFRMMGHRCAAVETSDAARQTAQAFHEGDDHVSIHSSTDPAWTGKFDCLASFEVLEHIEDDAAALSEWISFLRPAGHIVLSVPAGPQRWDASDEWAGHFRRYTRESLTELVTACGGQVERVETYGFPLANIIAPIRARSKSRARRAGDIAERTAESGIERSAERRALPILQSLPGRLALRSCFAMQALAADSELGPAYLLLGRKA